MYKHTNYTVIIAVNNILTSSENFNINSYGFYLRSKYFINIFSLDLYKNSKVHGSSYSNLLLLLLKLIQTHYISTEINY